MGLPGAQYCLQAGANDLGGVLMNESITRAAGAIHGQAMDAAQLIQCVSAIGRNAAQRNTLYTELASQEPPQPISEQQTLIASTL